MKFSVHRVSQIELESSLDAGRKEVGSQKGHTQFIQGVLVYISLG